MFLRSAAALIVVQMIGCSTAPIPNVAGNWLGGETPQLAVHLQQSGNQIKVAGQLAEVGTTHGYVLAVRGSGSIRSDSILTMELKGVAGHQFFAGKAVSGKVISGNISGDRVGSQQVTLTRQ